MAQPEVGHRVVGRYLLEERVGAGGMGVVWRATDTVLDRVVALKQVRLGLVDGVEAEAARQRVAREARVAARLHHPRTITIFDVVTEDGEPWLVLEYLPSRSLEEVLAGGTLPTAEAARIGVAVADALAVAHAAGVVHRDVKPGNVLVGAGGVVKLTDFGISRVVGELKLTRTGLVVGTLAYLAPEVAAGDDATAASDVFGLGALLYAALEGRAPFDGGADGNPLRGLRDAAAGRFPPPRRAGALTGVLAALLEVDPARRPTAAAARDLLEGSHPRPSRPDVPTRGEEPGGRSGSWPATRVPVTGPPVWVRDTAPPPETLTGSAPPRVPPSPPAASRRRTPLLVGGGLAAVVLLVVGTVVTLRGGGAASSGTPPSGAVAAPAACDTSRGDLTLGMIVPLSGSLEVLGVGMRNAADLAVAQANARCAVPGYRLVLDARDDQATPQVAGQAATALAADPSVVGVVGTLNSSTAQTVQPILADRSVPMISPANTNPTLSLGIDATTAPARPFPTYFRVSTTDLLQGPFAAQYLVQKAGKKSFAVIDDGKTYGSNLAEQFAAEAERLGATVVAREKVGEKDTDFSGVIAAIRPRNPDAVYYGGEYPAGGPLSGQLGQAGLNVPLAGGDGLVDRQYVTLGGRAGDLATNVGAPADSLPSAQQFVADYRAAAYADPATSYGPASYDATNVLVAAVGEAVRGGGWSVGRRAAVVAGVQATNLQGATGPLAFDRYGDTTNRVLTVYTVDNGDFAPVAGSTAAFQE